MVARVSQANALSDAEDLYPTRIVTGHAFRLTLILDEQHQAVNSSSELTVGQGGHFQERRASEARTRILLLLGAITLAPEPA